MKYIALVAVAAFIIFTAWFSKKTEELTIDQMNKMNNLISQYMTQAVQTNQPNATDIEFSQIYTEVIESGKKMKAQFKFSYIEPNSAGEMEKVYRKGTFLITSEDGKQWTAQIEQADDIKVEFMEPFQVDEGTGPAPGANESIDTPSEEATGNTESSDSTDAPEEDDGSDSE